MLRLSAFILLLLLSHPAFAGHHNASENHNYQDSMVVLQSVHDVKTTTDKLEKVLKKSGMTVFIRIDHSAGAKKANLELRPTEVVIFGNPKVGTPLMQCAQSIAIDLPQKMLIWQKADGSTWLSYNNPQYLADRHDLKGCDAVLKKVTGALNKFATAATQ